MSSDIGYEYAEHILKARKFLVLDKVANANGEHCVDVKEKLLN